VTGSALRARSSRPARSSGFGSVELPMFAGCSAVAIIDRRRRTWREGYSGLTLTAEASEEETAACRP
jgi:hypothetical protein